MSANSRRPYYITKGPSCCLRKERFSFATLNKPFAPLLHDPSKGESMNRNIIFIYF
ncbi:unnamed protein product [Hymenolepis diminuta]|uniref:Uncharacterized protein n=1 Tax=Hymenolepis diminuta TaxID=6216 RepID=A0A564Y1K0_HYMDI|nr:unnamed protein product [Hymenolepis diminuta]